MPVLLVLPTLIACRAEREASQIDTEPPTTTDSAPVSLVSCEVTATRDMAGDLIVTTYDPDGNALSEGFDGGYSAPDGVIDFGRRFLRDELGRLIAQEDFDGSVTSGRWMWSYTAGDRPDGRDWDAYADGIPDGHTSYSHDGEGHLLTEEYDDDMDGVVDYRFTYTLDAMGNRVLQTQATGADGAPYNQTVWTYDADGHVLVEERDVGADGSVEDRYSSSWSGDLLTAVEWEDGLGVVDVRWTYEYDIDSRRVRDLQDGLNTGGYDDIDVDPDGVPDVIVAYTYDTTGRLSIEAHDFDGDGTPNSTITYAYDDTDGDGACLTAAVPAVDWVSEAP